MDGKAKQSASIQSFFPPTPQTSPRKYQVGTVDFSSSQTPVGDGFTPLEVEHALKPSPSETWQPATEYADLDICQVRPGPGAVTFMGRVASLYDTMNTPKTPRSARGCVKLCVKDDTGTITVRCWYAHHRPLLKLGSLLSIWTTHVSNGENGKLSSASAPLFASIFPERDRTCHLMVHDNSDDGSMCRKPLGFRSGEPLERLMTLKNFVDGGSDVIAARVVVVVKGIGPRKQVTRKDGSVTENVNIHVHDDSSEATLGLWATAAHSPFDDSMSPNTEDCSASNTGRRWKVDETVLLLQAPACKPGRLPYLTLTASTIVDIDPIMPDAQWLRTWALRQRSREATNPSFPDGVFNYSDLVSGPVRCLYTLGALDEFARIAPHDTFQGYLSVIIMESRLLDCWKRHMLCAGECCNTPLYANAVMAVCTGCKKDVQLRPNPRILGQVIDETGCIAGGKLLLSDRAWKDLLGRGIEELLSMSTADVQHLSARMAFCRVTLLFGWTGDACKAGGRICVLGVQS